MTLNILLQGERRRPKPLNPKFSIGSEALMAYGFGTKPKL